MDIPLHTLMKLTPKAYGTVTDKYKAQVPAVSTWRSKGSTAKQHDSIIEGEALKLPGLETARSSTPLPELEIQGGFQTQRTDVILVSQRLMWHSEVESSCSKFHPFTCLLISLTLNRCRHHLQAMAVVVHGVEDDEEESTAFKPADMYASNKLDKWLELNRRMRSYVA